MRNPTHIFPAKEQWRPRRLALGLAALLASSCSSPGPSGVMRTQPTPLRNTPWKAAISATPAFEAEQAYIRARRRAAGLQQEGGAVALCFSGGGLRSATVNLGVLQGLEEGGLLKKADYLSAVSGGAYIASWYVSHLLPPGSQPTTSSKTLLRGGNVAYTPNRAALLQLDKCGPADHGQGSVDELEENRGFVLGRGNFWLWSGVLPAAYVASFPFNVVFDLAMHMKPYRGKFNLHHLSWFYEQAIRTTYLRKPAKLIAGQEDPEGFFDGMPHEVRLDEVNPPGSQAPYLVVNAALANNPSPENTANSEALPFEFTRHSVGAPFLGYIPAKHFGFPVLGVEKVGCSGAVALRSNSHFLSTHTEPLRLSFATAASGAAGDSNSAGELAQNLPPAESPVGPLPHIVTNRLSRDIWQKPLNLNLRQQNRNFAMLPPGRKQAPWTLADELKDRLRETTTDRLAPSIESNSLIMTDGAHWDDQAVFNMTLRKNVTEIWSFDASYGGSSKESYFEDLDRVVKMLEKVGWVCQWRGRDPRKQLDQCGKTPWRAGASPVFAANLTRNGRAIRWYYVKSSYRPGDGAGRHYRKPDGATVPLEKWLAAYQAEHPNFPCVSTAAVKFDQDQFNAYREIGRVIGGYLANTKKRESK